VDEAIDPDGVGGLDLIEENCDGKPLYTEVAGYYFKETV
jgi:hypothetical protein